MQYRAVVFDLYGTLVDILRRGEYAGLLREMGSVVGLDGEEFARGWLDETPRERLTGAFGRVEDNILHICRARGFAPDPACVTKAADMRRAYIMASLVPRPDAEGTIGELRRRGLCVGILTNCATATMELWERSVFPSLVDACVLSCEVRLRKPSPAIFRIMCERLRVDAADCLYIGDGDDHELDGAREAGMHPMLIRVPDEGEDCFRNVELDWRGPRISAISEVLDRLDRSCSS